MPKLRAAAFEVVTPTLRQRGVRSHQGGMLSRFPVAPIRVYVLRSDPLRAAGLQALFEDNAGIEINIEPAAGEVGTGWLDPDIGIVVVGTQLGTGTLKLIESIRSARPDLHILVMSPTAGDEAILSVLNLGAKGFLHEGCTPAQFEEAIRSVASGCIWAPRRLQAELIQRLLAGRDPRFPGGNASITRREQQVLNLLLDGKPNREIALTLKIEERTVKSYVARLMVKMGVSNRTALSMQAIAVKNC